MTEHSAYGLVGRTLGHSFSRSYFTEKFEQEGIDASYVNIELSDISGLPAAVASLGLAGFNVTAGVGAVNVVRVLPDGRMRGYNTDAPAFAESLGGLLAGRPVPRRALVLGTGGASRAVVAALRGMGIEPLLVSRTPGRGDLTYADLTARVMADCLLVVNATPVGTWPRSDEAPAIPYDALTPAHACFDLVYNPDPTLFMRRAAARGAAVRSGLEMLRLQAEGSWKIWNKPIDINNNE